MYRRRSAGPVCAIIMLLLLAACEGAGGPTPVPPTPSPPPAALAGPRFTVEATGCPWDLDAARATATGLTLRCGYVAVPEHHGPAAGSIIRLAVLVGQHDPAHPTADALIYLEGGPGARAHATDLGEFGTTGRDVIVFDQRGVGYSVPALNCPPLGNRDPLSAALDSQRDLTSCRDEVVQEGVHLDAYNIPEDAADVDSIRQALGYAQLDLYGVSYGTKVALAVLRDFPQTVRSAILDSVLPMQASVVADLPANIARALNLTFAACAADAACNAAYPNLQQVYFGVVAQLDAHPVALQVNSTPFQLTGARLTSLLLALLISGPEQLPRLVYSLKNGDYGLLGQYLSGEQAPGTDDAWVMTFSVACSDGHYGTPQEVATAAAPVAAALRGP
ncbi:MAG: alpha/beta hydrolase, partial [Candidatus Dormibacteraeota bacterium]|nr:alpha/beta hydrolase [Candidatus Dormibacteraeota bacterium]